MSTTKHREVAKLDRVPLPVEAARIGATGWQVTRTGARVVTKLAGRGSLQQKVIKQIPQTFADLGPTYVKFGQIIASSPGAFGEPLSREFRSLLDAGAARRHRRSPQAVQVEELGDEPDEPVQDLRRGAVRVGVDRAGALRDPAQRRGGRRQDPAAGHPPPRRRRPADPQARRAARRAGQAGPPAVRAGRRRRLRRQPRRGARLPARGAVDGRVGVAHARLAAGQEHPGAAGLLGPDQRSGC